MRFWWPKSHHIGAAPIVEGGGRTRVDLGHRNLERMGQEPGDKVRNAVDNGWPGLLALYATACGGARP